MMPEMMIAMTARAEADPVRRCHAGSTTFTIKARAFGRLLSFRGRSQERPMPAIIVSRH